MAVDELLMKNASSPGFLPTLRVYSWNKPSYSAGYFQNLNEIKKSAKPGAQIVKRLSGGGLVFHGEDLTFSLIMRYPNAYFSNDTKASYLKINEALLAGFRKLYPELDFADCKTIPSGRANNGRVCFESPACYDLVLEGRKVVGSSQRRSGGTLLYQSTIFLKNDVPTLREKLLEGFRSRWKIDFKNTPLSDEELKEAETIKQERYSDPEWAISS